MEFSEQHPPIPSWLIKSARKIDLYFKDQGCDTWELGWICSRNHATRLKEIDSIIDKLNIRNIDSIIDR